MPLYGPDTTSVPGKEDDVDRMRRIIQGRAAGSEQAEQTGQQRRNIFTVGGRPTQTGMRAGLPAGGQVGAPNLGQTSALNQWARQVPGGAQYLQQLGIMPQTQTYGPPQGNTPSGPTTTERGFGRGNDSPAGFVVPGQQMGGMSGFGGGAPNLNVQRQQSPFEKLMQGSISGQLRDPTGFNRTQQQMLRNRAAEPIAGQQQINMQRTQEDAVRRGASGAAGDADIRDQLNRVGAQGAKDQSDASLNIDQMLAQLRQSGLSSGHAAGNSLLGTQTTDVRSLREMLTALFALQQQNGPGGMGLNIALGGR